MDNETALLPSPPAPVREPMRAWLATTAMLTPVAALAGALVGWYLVESMQKSARTIVQTPPSHEPAIPAGSILVELAPIVTNLADPPETRVRLQAAILLDPAERRNTEVVAAQIGEDILGFLRTISLSSIGGASGLRHLREDLNERAKIRSDGKVRELVIRALVVQ